MSQNWFNGLNDTTLKQTAAIRNPDLYIQEELYEGDAVYTTATELFTIAGAAYTIDALISAGVQNILVIDDNDKVASTIITDNDATTVTIVEANLLLEEDQTTAATLSDGVTYTIRIYTPGTATQPFGKFFGYVEGLDPQITDEYAKFKYPDAPKKLQFKDLLERQVQISGGAVNIAKKDILTSIFNAAEYGNNASTDFNLGIGSNPTSSVYRLWAVTENRIKDPLVWMFRKCQFESTGSILGSAESGHKMINWLVDCLADDFYPTTADFVQVTGYDR